MDETAHCLPVMHLSVYVRVCPRAACKVVSAGIEDCFKLSIVAGCGKKCPVKTVVLK